MRELEAIALLYFAGAGVLWLYLTAVSLIAQQACRMLPHARKEDPHA